MIALSFIRKNIFVLSIAIVFFFLPFFWFPKEAVDLGGDGNRLYFYDPVSFLKNVSLYSIVTEGKSHVDPLKHAYLFYVGFIAVLKYFLKSPHVLINVFNGIKLSAAFLSVYLMVKEITLHGFTRRKRTFDIEIAAILAGMFYILGTGSESLIFFWIKALHSHDQIFLNPLIFYLTLRYLLTRNRWYLIGSLFVTFIFSVDFAAISSPPFFAFYPVAFVFLFLYVRHIRHTRIYIGDILLGLVFFVGLHAYHLIPSIMNLFDTSSIVNSIVFKETVSGGVNFFSAIQGEGKAIKNLLLSSPVSSFRWTSFVALMVIIIGFFLQKKRYQGILLTGIFFFITFFLVTANITSLGLEFYRLLFYIPGFSMFRHFFIQWAYIYLFFYALLFGQSCFVIASRLKNVVKKILLAVVLVAWGIGFYPFLSGNLVDGIQWGSNNVRTAMIMDPRYEDVLAYVRRLPDDGKILMLPLTDNFNQVVFGLNNAAYVGPSSISILTSKKSFSGYQIFYPNPIPETIMRLSREEKYKALSQIFSLFNIRYIFHNTDPKIYEAKFPNFPNSYMMTSMPKTQAEYKEFVKKFPVRQIYENGPFQMFEFDETVYRPEVYIPDSMYIDDMLQKVEDQTVSYQSVFIDPADCKQGKIIADFCNAKYQPPSVALLTTKVNPTRYTIRVKQSESSAPFLLVFQNSFHTSWKLSIDERPPLREDRHVLANKYANAWIITENDRKGKTEYSVSLNLEIQKYFSYGLWITGFSFVVFLGWIIKAILYKKKV